MTCSHSHLALSTNLPADLTIFLTNNWKSQGSGCSRVSQLWDTLITRSSLSGFFPQSWIGELPKDMSEMMERILLRYWSFRLYLKLMNSKKWIINKSWKTLSTSKSDGNIGYIKILVHICPITQIINYCQNRKRGHQKVPLSTFMMPCKWPTPPKPLPPKHPNTSWLGPPKNYLNPPSQEVIWMSRFP